MTGIHPVECAVPPMVRADTRVRNAGLPAEAIQCTGALCDACTRASPANGRPRSAAAPPQPAPGNPVVLISTSLGDVTVELFKDKARSRSRTSSVRRRRLLCRDHFHRVVRASSSRAAGSRRDGGEADPSADPERGDQRPAQPPRHGRDGPHRRALRSATSQFYFNVANNPRPGPPRASRRATSATPSSAACSPAWTSWTASPRCPPTLRAGMEDVPVDPVMITGVKVVR